MGRPDDDTSQDKIKTQSQTLQHGEGTDASSGSDSYLDTSPETSRVVVAPIRSWKGYVWDTWDLPSEQRRLLFKVDAVVLTFASLGYFLKNLDQTNVNNAFLSGMKEDLGMWGNELVTSTSIWTVGYVVGQVPSNLLLTRVSPRWVIPSVSINLFVCLSVCFFFFFNSLYTGCLLCSPYIF
jgi:hypothetical protein